MAMSNVKRKASHRLLAALLSIAMVFSMIPFSMVAYAATTSHPDAVTVTVVDDVTGEPIEDAKVTYVIYDNDLGSDVMGKENGASTINHPESLADATIPAVQDQIDKSKFTAEITLTANQVAQYRGYLSVLATDAFQNKSVKKVDNGNIIVVDTIAPEISVEYTEADRVIGQDYFYNNDVDVKFTVTEANFYAEDVEVTVTKNGEAFNYGSVSWGTRNAEDKVIGTFTLPAPADHSGDGHYVITVVKDIRFNKAWAMKACDKKNRYYSPAIRENILTEPYMMQKLNHPAIPRVVDVIEDEDSIFIVRDYIEGETLETIVRMYGAQPADKVIKWGKQMCSVLGYLHSQNPPLIYRDMKPANVILKPDETIKFIDFGIMRTYKPNQSSDTCCLGTKGYAAPEQFGGSQTDGRTDIFGLGMTMFRLVTGLNPTEPPYEIGPICLVNPNLPKGLEYIISKCTRPNPAERYQSCDELMADLNNYLELPKPKGIFGKLFGKK